MKVTNFSKKCRKLRVQLGLSRKDLAEKIGVAEITVRHWETGIMEPRQPTKTVLKQLLKK